MQAQTQTKTAKSGDRLHVLVFKDDLASRSFRLPLKWLTSVGLILGLGVILLTGASLLAVKYYRLTLRTDPARVLDLERELRELKSTYLVLKEAFEEPTTSEASKTKVSAKDQPVLFSALPLATRQLPKTRFTPIELDRLRVSWENLTLNVTFNLLYTAKDGKAQRGRIVVLARGPNSFYAYPAGTLNSSKESTLINFEKGDNFKVSRFRSTSAKFPSLSRSMVPDEVEVLVFNQAGHILLSEKMAVPPPGSPAASAPRTPPIISSPPAVAPQPATPPPAQAPSQATPNAEPDAAAVPPPPTPQDETEESETDVIVD